MHVTLRRVIPAVFVKSQLLNMYRYTVKTQLCYIIRYYTRCPTCYRTTRHFFINFTTNKNIVTKFEADVPHCVRNVKEQNVHLFKFLCNIFTGVRIITEMPGSVASGTPCTTYQLHVSAITYPSAGCTKLTE
jgi:hypothetical protein